MYISRVTYHVSSYTPGSAGAAWVLAPLHQRLLALAVEDVHLVHIRHHLDRLADAGVGARVEAGDQLLAAVLDVGVDLGAERLDPADIGREPGHRVDPRWHLVGVGNILAAVCDE